MTEAEKYGPKGQGNASHNGHVKPEKPKKNSDVDINVGLSSRPPWFCSLCNTQATSKQALLIHADGKKHRAKARAFHASQNQTTQTEEEKPKEEALSNNQMVEVNGSSNIVEESGNKDSSTQLNGTGKEEKTKKRKANSKELKTDLSSNNGEVIQAEKTDVSDRMSKKKKGVDDSIVCKEQAVKQETSDGKIKWKKLITSTLKSSDGAMKIKKLQKLVLKSLKESGVKDDDEELREKLIGKINSSSRFSIDSKRVCLVSKIEES